MSENKKEPQYSYSMTDRRDWAIHDHENDFIVGFFEFENWAKKFVHCVNTHDELQAENERLKSINALNYGGGFTEEDIKSVAERNKLKELNEELVQQLELVKLTFEQLSLIDTTLYETIQTALQKANIK